ncbi:lipid-transfer protein [Rhodococcus aetherivorans]|uniref:propanoyl-CoA C-acyltransferase n=1 Tax=Rhodococcus aetherivorans TaxID=191292 RepID=A0AA46SA06_9NOCA|nr:lipid-transfer protein [Rhodococcus aetherivorans]AKE88212.1 lipid-transfer protein [Rhodococcus aetherivorans]UYF94055.1 lipid-transfer protein [Rhodococcus aetherivorans]
MNSRVLIAGVGMVPFTKPSAGAKYDEIGAAAAAAALEDAGLSYDQVGQVYAGYVYGDSTSGQRVVYQLGMTRIPVLNVNNNCASGSSALWLARQAVANGATECALTIGFEQMPPGALTAKWNDRPAPLSAFMSALEDVYPVDPALPMTPQYFAAAAQEYLDTTDSTVETLAAVAVKARTHARTNPRAVFRDPITLEDVLSSPTVAGTLTRLQCCPPTSGAAAAVVCTEEFARKHGLDARVAITAQALESDDEGLFDSPSAIALVGSGVTRRTADRVYAEAGVDPADIDVVELHDCFTINEILTYEGLGLCEPGGAAKFIADGDNTYGGRVVTNPSGGLLSKGHPLGATGLAQIAEITWQLRGSAGDRQVPGARLGLQHNLGLGTAGVVTILERLS